MRQCTMSISSQIAKHLRDVHFGGNWTCVNYKDTLAGITWEQATEKVQSFNTIATLVFHTGYYLAIVAKVLQGGPLSGKDTESFDVPPIESQEDWERLLERVWGEVEEVAALIEQVPDSRLEEVFPDVKYGTYYRNLAGMVEHFHYHLGQIVLIKKLLWIDVKGQGGIVMSTFRYGKLICLPL